MPSSMMQSLGWALRTIVHIRMDRPLWAETSNLFRGAVGWDITLSMLEQFLRHQQFLHRLLREIHLLREILLLREIRRLLHRDVRRYLHLRTIIGHRKGQHINLCATLELLALLKFGTNQ